MNLVVPFEQTDMALTSLVGGKGYNLILLTGAGFPVPPGFVVSAEAYRLFLDHVSGLDEELADFDYANPDVLREQCGKLRERLEKVALPASVADAIKSALAKFPADAPFAVRSSSTFEDMAQAAFAGQHDTFLNVRGPDMILSKVRDCFVSLWQDRAVLYRRHQGFTQKDARMAVVVQRQVACDRAGVGFSINPVSGRLDRLAIDANYGLGESVVSGEFAIDHYELDKATLQVVECALGHKDRMVTALAAGVAEQAVPAELADQPCLSAAQLQGVAQLIKKVETHYGWPQDIEWGWLGSELFLFQSRPVTTMQPRWTREESAERFPRPMTPLSWDFLQVGFKASMTHSLALMGLPPLQGDWFAWFDHYIYGNQNAVALIAAFRPLKARSPRELAAEIPALRRRFGWVLELPVHWARDLDRYLLRLGALTAVPLTNRTVPKIWRHMLKTLEVAGEYFKPNIAISMTQAFLHRLLHGLVGMAIGPEQALAVVDGLLAGCETKTAVVNRELHELAQMAASLPLLAKALAEQPGHPIMDGHMLKTYPDFWARLGRFLEDHGHREMDMDYYHPTWSENPAIVLDAIGLILRGGATDPRETARNLRLRHAETELQFLSKVPDDLRFFFRELIRLTRTYTILDDLEHYQTTRVNPIARRAALALGERLRERGIVTRADEVFFLHKSDLEALVAAYPNEDKDAFRAKARAGKEAYEAALRRAPAWSLEEAPAEMPSDDAKVLKGLPGSPGQVSGPCRRVLDPRDFARFPKGAILVARTTNPAWTPLFYSAAGLITESGGPLSHGAVTAREMNLPAVMSVRDVLNKLHDGQVVTIDGSQGWVRIE
ncbi:MAG TPA: PEP/pyruvate-binding domain-containing protein [Gemmataceae bacterium]|nr:PEP/pyruvate-binding domain-containing protein [Gemmataceae bacterium]